MLTIGLNTTKTFYYKEANYMMPDDNKQRRLAIRTGLAFMDVFKAIRHTMPAQYISTFLLVAYSPGKSVLEYAKLAGVAQSVMSRHLLDLGERARNKEPGFGLIVTKADPMDLRTHKVTLSPKGEAVLAQVERALLR